MFKLVELRSMNYTIEFDKTYNISLTREERIVIVNRLNCPAVFRIIKQHWLNNDGEDTITYEYFINEYYLSPNDDASMDDVSLDVLVEAWFESNKDYYWNHN